MSSNNQSLSIPKKTRLRFRDEDDLIFLREVLGYNPFRQPDLWAVIQEHVFAATGKQFSIKTLKDHLDLLIKIWLEKTKKYKDRSGIEEDYTEKDKLLEEVYGLMVEFRMAIKKNQKQGGVAARDHWAKENYNSVLLSFHNEEEVVATTKLDNILSVDNTIILDHQYSISADKQGTASSDITRKRPLEAYSQENNNFPQKIGKIQHVKNSAPTEAPTLENVETFHTENQQAHATTSFSENNINTSDIGQTPTGPSKGKYNVFNRNKSRARKSSIQKQGLAIVQEYDKNQNDIKRKELKLREQELQLQEKKLDIENRRLDLEERREEQKQQTKRKTLEILESAMSSLTKIVENQEKLIYFIVTEKK